MLAASGRQRGCKADLPRIRGYQQGPCLHQVNVLVTCRATEAATTAMWLDDDIAGSLLGPMLSPYAKPLKKTPDRTPSLLGESPGLHAGVERRLRRPQDV